MHRTPFRTRTAIVAGLALTGGLAAGLPHAETRSAPAAQPDAAEPLPSPRELARLPEAVIAHRDGRQIQGEILGEDNYRIVINLAGIRTEVLRADINSIRRLPPALDRYDTVRASIPPQDIESRLGLVEWLRTRELYPEALREIEIVLSQEPAHPTALQMRRWLEAQMRMRRTDQTSPQTGAPRAESLDVIKMRVERPTQQAELPTLDETQINTIRVYEVDLKDPPRMVIPRGTLEKLFQSYGASALMPQTKTGRDALARRPASEILELMFRLKARELYPEVRVLEDPPALKFFRDRVHGRGGWLINSCGSVRCHGGTESGPFQLVTRRPFSDEAVYTNFYILDTYTLADGTPLIDYDEPAGSPLLLMATRRENSSRPHPPTEADRGPMAWKPIFDSTTDDRFQQAVGWIRSLYRPRPDYGIQYPPKPPAPNGDAEEGLDRSAPANETGAESPVEPPEPAQSVAPGVPETEPTPSPTPPAAEETDPNPESTDPEGNPDSPPDG